MGVTFKVIHTLDFQKRGWVTLKPAWAKHINEYLSKSNRPSANWEDRVLEVFKKFEKVGRFITKPKLGKG